MNWDTVVTAVSVIGGLGATLWTIRRATKSDKVIERSGVASDSRADTALLIDNLHKMLDQRQENGASDRETIRLDRETIKQCAVNLGDCVKERDDLRIENARLRKRSPK